MAYKIHEFASDSELAKRAAADWLAALKERPANQPYTVALSGGRIARNFFAEIAAQAKAITADTETLFNGVHFFWADERCVPPTDPESNYAIAKQLLFDPLKIDSSQIHRLRGEGDEAAGLKEAINAICSLATVKEGQPTVDLVFLGMGEDGHVASLFPGEPISVMEDAAVYRAVTAVKPPPRRFTLGYAAIMAAKRVWVIAAGAGKEAALRESVKEQGKTPLSRILQKRGQTEIYTDIKIGG